MSFGFFWFFFLLGGGWVFFFFFWGFFVGDNTRLFSFYSTPFALYGRRFNTQFFFPLAPFYVRQKREFLCAGLLNPLSFTPKKNFLRHQPPFLQPTFFSFGGRVSRGDVLGSLWEFFFLGSSSFPRFILGFFLWCEILFLGCFLFSFFFFLFCFFLLPSISREIRRSEQSIDSFALSCPLL